MSKKSFILPVFIAFLIFQHACKIKLPELDNDYSSASERLSIYKQVPDKLVLLSADRLDYHYDEDNNIKYRYVVQSNKFNLPVNYGLSANNIGVTEVLFERDGVLLDYTPGFDEIIFVLEGELKLIADNNFEFLLSPDSAIFIKAEIKRRLINNTELNSTCIILSSPPYNPDSLNENPVTLTEENLNSFISPVIAIEQMDFLETNKVQIQKLFNPDVYPTTIILGIITLPGGASVKDINMNTESIYLNMDNEIIIHENKHRTNYIISKDKYMYIPKNVSVDLFNASPEMRSLVYFYPLY